MLEHLKNYQRQYLFLFTVFILFAYLIYSPSTRKTMRNCDEITIATYPKISPKASSLFLKARRMETLKGYPRDYAVIAKLYQQAVELGHWKAINNLGRMYMIGQGVERDEEKALALFKRLEAMNIPEGYRAMAHAYERGLASLPKDRKKVVEYLNKAAEMGDPESMVAYGKGMMLSTGSDADLAEALKAFKCAFNNGYAEASYYLALSYRFNKDFKRYYETLIEGANMGGGTIGELERTFRLGLHGFPKDEIRGKCFLELLIKTKDKVPLEEDIRKLCPSNFDLPYGITGG